MEVTNNGFKCKGPYRMFAADHFDDTKLRKSVYGAVSIISNSKGSVFWDNTSDTFIDVWTSEKSHS
jgi:hypothetical protein